MYPIARTTRNETAGRVAAAVVFCAAAAVAVGPLHAEVAPPETDEQKTLYALGLALSQQLTTFGFSEREHAFVAAGFKDGLLRREPHLELAEWGPRIDGYLQTRLDARAELEKSEGAAFLVATAEEPGAVVTESGLIYFERSAGEGEPVEPGSTVRIAYVGRFRDDTVFDRSEEGHPETLSLEAVMPCLAEGIGRMRVGGHSRLVCPPGIAYGERGAAPFIPPHAALVFDVELVAVEPAGDPAPAGAPVPDGP